GRKALVEFGWREWDRGRGPGALGNHGQRSKGVLDRLGGAARRGLRRGRRHRLLIASATNRRIDACGNDLAIDGPAAAKHEACNRSPADKASFSFLLLTGSH